MHVCAIIVKSNCSLLQIFLQTPLQTPHGPYREPLVYNKTESHYSLLFFMANALKEMFRKCFEKPYQLLFYVTVNIK